jgi:tetratricopeptide (TPR) repeat protein
VLTATTGRCLAFWLTHLWSIYDARATPAESNLWLFFNPVDWACAILGAVLVFRTWRLAVAANGILPRKARSDQTRTTGADVILVTTIGYSLALLLVVGASRYQATAVALGIDTEPGSEDEALRALDQGAIQAKKGDLDAAEKSLQRALPLWEKLAKRRSAPPHYRRNLATTLFDLGCVREHQERDDEAEAYYTRALAIGQDLGEAGVDNDFHDIMAKARRSLANLHTTKVVKELVEIAVRKYEEARAKAQKGEPEAEGLFQEAIGLWEEILGKAISEEYRTHTFTVLVTAHGQLARTQQVLAHRAAEEATLKKAIDYGEKAVARDPNQAQCKLNLETARFRLFTLRETAFREEIDQLYQARRHGRILERYQQSVEEQEEQVRSGKERDSAQRLLAYRLNSLAWFLAHCADARLRDTKLAIKHARRATELHPDLADYWYTLAMVQYRNGDWEESLASLEKVKAREVEVDGSDLFLSALNLHHLKRRDEARAALREGIEWMNERKRQAEGDALQRFEYETIREELESLRREAENLIER